MHRHRRMPKHRLGMRKHKHRHRHRHRHRHGRWRTHRRTHTLCTAAHRRVRCIWMRRARHTLRVSCATAALAGACSRQAPQPAAACPRRCKWAAPVTLVPLADRLLPRSAATVGCHLPHTCRRRRPAGRHLGSHMAMPPRPPPPPPPLPPPPCHLTVHPGLAHSITASGVLRCSCRRRPHPRFPFPPPFICHLPSLCCTKPIVPPACVCA